MAKSPVPILNIDRDFPDDRDWIYRPSLNTIAWPELVPPATLSIMDQGASPACAGYALAATINLLLHRSGRTKDYVSARMLYLMAKRHDEWAGEDYEGSSLRGAIAGWKNMGVCDFRLWSRVKDDLTVERAKDARNRTLGAYYRLLPEITHFHAALNEIGVIYVSAATHSGWNKSKATTKDRREGVRKAGLGELGPRRDGKVIRLAERRDLYSGPVQNPARTTTKPPRKRIRGGLASTPKGNRTPVSGVRGRRPNR